MGYLKRAGIGSAICLGLALPVAAQDAAVPAVTAEAQTYDLLFKDGTLDGIEGPIRYDRAASNSTKPDMAERDTGIVEIAFEEPEDRSRQAILTFEKDGRERGLGAFPASVGNPIIMYFMETVVRDMAEIAGGSPFYIRNRVKDALVQPAEIADVTLQVDGREVDGTAVTLRPFDGDPNVDRMQGFGDLALTVTMAEEVPGWYQSLAARIEGPSASRQDYTSVLTFDGTGPGAAR